LSARKRQQQNGRAASGGSGRRAATTKHALQRVADPRGQVVILPLYGVFQLRFQVG
jgi:hypothetical protein